MCNFIYAKGSLKELFHKSCGFHYVQFCMCKRKFKGTVSWDFRLRIFHVSVSPKTLSIPLVPFEIFLQIRWNIHSSRCTTGITGTGGKFTTGAIDTSGKLPLVSLTSVSLIPVANCHWCHWHRRQICSCIICHWHRRQICSGIIDTGGKFSKMAANFFLNSQIRKLLGSICNRKSANFWDMQVRQFYICVFIFIDLQNPNSQIS